MKMYRITPRDSGYIYYTFAESISEAKTKLEKAINQRFVCFDLDNKETQRQKTIAEEVERAVIREHNSEVVEIWIEE